MKEFFNKYREKIILAGAGALLAIVGLIAGNVIQNRLGFSVVSGYQSTVRTSMTATQDTVAVSSLTLKDDTTLDMSMLGSRVFLTLEPGKSKEEIVMCTGITTSTLTFTGCTRGLAFSGTSTVSVSANRKTHNAGAIVTLSNVHYVYEQLVDKDGTETIGGLKTFSDLVAFSTIPVMPTTTPTSSDQVASKQYVDNVIAAGAPNGTESVKGLFEGATQSEMGLSTEFGSTGATLALLSKYATSTRNGAGQYVIVTAGSGYVSSTFGGVAFSMATLDSNALVVQNPASATTTPTINSIPLTNASTTELNRWVQAYERQYTAGEPINASVTPTPVYLSSVDGKVYQASSNFTSSTFNFVGFVGKSQNVTTSDNVYVTGGEGAIIPGFTGLTVGTEYYISTTGTIATSGGTVPWKIARAVSTTALIIEKAPKKYVGTYSNNQQSDAGAAVTTTVNVGFRPKKISIIASAGNRDDTTVISKFDLRGNDPWLGNNPFWYEGTTYGLQFHVSNNTSGDDSTYLVNAQDTNVFSRLSILSVTNNTATFLWQYDTTSNGNSNDQAWINYAYIIEE